MGQLFRALPLVPACHWSLKHPISRKSWYAWRRPAYTYATYTYVTGGPLFIHPPRDPRIDGMVVPSAAGGSLMFTPDIALPALETMRERFGDKLYGKYGFVDAFNPTTGWVDSDVIGINVGITLLSAENLRTGDVWRWFMRNPEILAALRRAGLRQE